MKLNVKIVGLLVFGFFVVSTGLTFSSVQTLKKSQTENLQLFKEEFLELGQESFINSSNLFFYALENSIKTSTSSAEFFTAVQNIDPKNTVIYDISLNKYILRPNDTEIIKLTNENTLNKYIQENTLNLKDTFDLDNFQSFLNNTSGKGYPVKVQLRIYKDLGYIIGYTKAFTTAKVRIEFIQRKNVEIFKSYVMSAITTVIITMVTSITVMIFLMKIVVINPLKKISLGLEQVKKGILSTKIDIKNTDEIGEIADTFNSMTQDLEISKNKIKEYYSDLEQKIEERTESLNTKLKELEKLNKLMIDRELKMIDLKKQIKELEDQQLATT